MRRRAIFRPPPLLLSLLLAGSLSPLAAKPYFVIISGLGGEARYAQDFAERVEDLRRICESTSGDPSLVHVLSGPAATRTAIEELFAGLRAATTEIDTVTLLLIGHGSYDGRDYKFNVPGPDPTAARIAKMLDALPAKDQLVVVATSSSGATLKSLKADRRIVITATKNGRERLATVFASYWVDALKASSADTNKDEVISALEAFEHTKKQVEEHYEKDKKLATEHARLEGEGAGGFTLVRLGALAGTPDDPRILPLTEKRGNIERRIAELKSRKDAMESGDYRSQLRVLLIQIARTQAEIDKLTGES
jgi:hypothetical protein